MHFRAGGNLPLSLVSNYVTSPDFVALSNHHKVNKEPEGLVLVFLLIFGPHFAVLRTKSWFCVQKIDPDGLRESDRLLGIKPGGF